MTKFIADDIQADVASDSFAGQLTPDQANTLADAVAADYERMKAELNKDQFGDKLDESLKDTLWDDWSDEALEEASRLEKLKAMPPFICNWDNPAIKSAVTKISEMAPLKPGVIIRLTRDEMYAICDPYEFRAFPRGLTQDE